MNNKSNKRRPSFVSVVFVLVIALATIVGACASDSKQDSSGGVRGSDSSLIVEDSTDYTSPEQLVARAYSITKFSELRNRCTMGYVFVTLTAQGVYPSSSSVNMDSLNIDWQTAQITNFDSTTIQLIMPHIIFAETDTLTVGAQTLQQTIGFIKTTALMPSGLDCFVEVLLVKDKQTIVAVGFARR
ncbi:hypothetical protein JYT16_01875 [Gemmatimonas aurantiaca]|nr:hypothetical protein [Gemmatimonas aurantiaca]